MVVSMAVVVLLAVGWYLVVGPGPGRRPGRRDAERPPEAVPSDFGRWPGIRDSAAEGREAILTRQLLAGQVEPSVYRRLMAELARDNSEATGRW